MARRTPPPDPKLVALARERLARVLGHGSGPRRAVSVLGPGVADDEGAGRQERAAPGPAPVGLDDLEPPRRFTRWHLAVVAVVLLVGLGWGGWSWLRARPEAVAATPVVQTVSAPTAPTSSEPSDGTSSGASGGGAAAGGSAPATPAAGAGLVVHVLGAVRHPGLVRLATGARVEDALEAAGGLRRDADPGELNLAQPLDDGVQVVVGTRSHPAGEVRSSGAAGTGSGGSTGTGSTASGSGAVVDLNRASAEQLETLPGVGPVTAQKILDWRQQHGRFSKVEELQEVDGIGPKTYARLAPHARV